LICSIPEPCPPQFRAIQPLCLSLGGLQEKFVGILTSQGFSLSDFNWIVVNFVISSLHSYA